MPEGPENGNAVAVVEPTPAPAVTPVAAPQAPAPEAVSIPLDQIPQGYDRDFHKWFQDAKIGRQATDDGTLGILELLRESKITPAAYLAMMREAANQEPGQPNAPETPPADQPPVPPSLTKDDVRQEIRTAFTENESERVEKDARQAEAAFRHKTLEDAGYKLGEDGKPTSRYDMAVAIFDRCVVKLIQDGLPTYATEKEKLEATKAPVSQDLLTQAGKVFKEASADFSNQAVAAVADNTKDTPTTTLGEGPAGEAPTTPVEQMSGPQALLKITQGVVKPEEA